MAVDLILEVFPGAQVEWERTARVPKPVMIVDETTSGDEIAAFNQYDMSDDFRGPDVEMLKGRLLKYKNKNVGD
jgi:hypothetical protein